MIIRDTEAIEKAVIEAAIDDYREKCEKYILASLKNAVYIDSNADPTNMNLRMGKALTHEEFERRLGKLNPALKFDQHPWQPTRRYVWWEVGGKKETLSVYDKGAIPESSILFRYEEKQADPEYITGARKLDRKDFPKATWNDEKQAYDFAGDIPGVITTYIPGSEYKRGWRTTLAKVLLSGAVPLVDIIKEFGEADTAEWAGLTGRQGIVRPW